MTYDIEKPYDIEKRIISRRPPSWIHLSFDCWLAPLRSWNGKQARNVEISDTGGKSGSRSFEVSDGLLSTKGSERIVTHRFLSVF